jgi:hypothetical protein
LSRATTLACGCAVLRGLPRRSQDCRRLTCRHSVPLLRPHGAQRNRTGRERRAVGASGAVDVAVHVDGLRPGDVNVHGLRRGDVHAPSARGRARAFGAGKVSRPAAGAGGRLRRGERRRCPMDIARPRRTRCTDPGAAGSPPQAVHDLRRSRLPAAGGARPPGAAGSPPQAVHDIRRSRSTSPGRRPSTSTVTFTFTPLCSNVATLCCGIYWRATIVDCRS